MITGVLFYAFAAVLVVAALGVITSRNPVHAALFLVLAFVQSSFLWLLIEAEFLAIALVLVYVGAVMVLFLFVVMMLDINFVELRQGFLQYLPIGGLIGAILLIELGLVLGGWVITPMAKEVAAEPLAAVGQVTNTHALGSVLYTKYIFLFQGAGLILLVAMIGAIVLTLRSRPGVRRQSIAEQIGRRREDAVVIKKVEPRQGI
ncbi:MAG TPA: NADH-quinone oxidoreductase subunit J [Ferrovibrio sp.]|uniref:NADH-quinone oxidoreductase subunit J n=1 Tax=Ferrovibrio sp. TaxID=1917215 RepID=UPI002ED6A930